MTALTSNPKSCDVAFVGGRNRRGGEAESLHKIPVDICTAIQFNQRYVVCGDPVRSHTKQLLQN